MKSSQARNTATYEKAKHKQLEASQPRLDMRPIAEDIANLIVNHTQDPRLKWNKNGSVQLLIGKFFPGKSVVRATFRATLKESLYRECWKEVRPYVYKRLPTKHEQVSLKVGYFEADVDKELSPLIEQLWKAEIETDLSCQENRPGIAWIVFSTVDDIARFLNIVAIYEFEEGSLYQRISNTDDFPWEYDLYPRDLAINETYTAEGTIEESHDGQTYFSFQISVRFPRTDLPILLDRMTQHNAWAENSP